MKCKDCKHWSADKGARFYEAPESHGMCEYIPAVDMPHIPEFKGMAVIPADFDHMPLITRHDFFCALHEKK